MTDPRRTPRNERVAATALQGKVDAPAFVDGSPMQVAVPVADLLRRKDGPRDRQLLFGDPVEVFETRRGWCFIQSEKDGYVGYLPETCLSPRQAATHQVIAPATHVYSQADFKSPEVESLSFASRITALGTSGKYTETAQGFIPSIHLAPIGTTMSDPADVAEMFLGTPYLWGGNSRWGIDCSGLVQAACLASHIPCPGDSDQQEAELGEPLPEGTAPRRNDLFFWKGHVALAVSDSTLIHANAYHMAVVHEDIDNALARIVKQGDGRSTSHKRLTLPQGETS